MPQAETRRTSLRARLGVIALVFLLVVIVAVGVSAVVLQSWSRTIDSRRDVRMAAQDIFELRLAVADQEAGLRDFALTSEPTSLDPYRDGRALQRRVVDRLQANDVELTELDARLVTALEAVRAWQDEIAEPTIADPESAPGEDVIGARFDEVRDELDGLEAIVSAELARLDGEVERARRTVFTVLFSSALLAIAITAVAASLFRRWVIVPLAEIGASARRLADDDTSPMPRFDAPELQDVSDAVDLLQASLRSARDDAIATLGAIEQSAVLAIQVRSELADEIGEMPDGWAAHTLLVPAEGVVAGDCFDMGLLDTGRMYVVLIDVTGHGASAALNALKAKAQLRAALRSQRGPGPALDWLSREMLKDGNADLLTAFVGLIDLDTGRVRYANAGHPPPLMTDGVDVVELETGGPLIGAFEATWSTAETELPPGWTLVVHSDGVTDAVGDERERFGDDRLRASIDTAEPVALLDHIQLEVERFRRGPRVDDITVIAMHRATPLATGNDPTTSEHPREHTAEHTAEHTLEHTLEHTTEHTTGAEPEPFALPTQEDTLPA